MAKTIIISLCWTPHEHNDVSTCTVEDFDAAIKCDVLEHIIDVDGSAGESGSAVGQGDFIKAWRSTKN